MGCGGSYRYFTANAPYSAADDLAVKLGLLVILFWVTAGLYASIGFGGGSTYTALLVLFETDYRLIPLIALSCNILVVSGNTWRYHRARLIPWARIWPLLLISMPAAWLGGRMVISETLFLGLLWAALLLAGGKLWLDSRADRRETSHRKLSTPFTIVIGAFIGFYAGLVGIGGGIFLAPILHMLHWAKAKVIAASCSVFILFNSAAGLMGQYNKWHDTNVMNEMSAYWPLIPAILIGGFIGNHLGVYRLADIWLKRATAILIIFVALRLMVKWIGLIT
jgi:uncharacterized membrane protein YfcA